jgi:hypothetical protein
MRDNMIGIGFKTLSETARSQFNITGEIMKFSIPKGESKRYYVNYETLISKDNVQPDYEAFKSEITREEFDECFPTSSTTQTSKPYFSKKNKLNIANFSFPVEFQLIEKHLESETDTDESKPNIMAFLFEIFSLDDSNINRYEGHGVYYLPLKSGHYSEEIQINREVQSTFDEIKRYFIGGISTIKNKRDFVLRKENATSIQNFSNRILVNSGVLSIRFNVCEFSESIKQTNKEIHLQNKIKDRVAKQVSEFNENQ